MNKTTKELVIFLVVVLVTIALGLGVVLIFKSINKTDNTGTSKGLPLSWEMKFKKLVKRQIKFESIIIENDYINNSINKISKHLISNIDEMPYEVEIIIVDSPIINALTFPGGLIVIYSGLIKITDSPHELSSIIAHELGHVAHRDSLNALVRQFGIAMLFAIVTGGDANIIDNIVRSVINNRFTNEMEKKADDFAFDLMDKSNINPKYFANVFNKIKEKEDEFIDEKILKYIGDHPTMNARIEKANKRSEQYYKKDYDFNINWDKLKKSLPSVFN